MGFAVPPSRLYIHPNPAVPNCILQFTTCEDCVILNSAQTSALNLPRELRSSRLILEISESCTKCYMNELTENGYRIDHKNCIRTGCDEKIVRGAGRNEGGKCWVCALKLKVDEVVNDKDYKPAM